MRKVKRNFVSCVVALSFVFILTCSLEAANLTVGVTSGSPGDKDILIPVDLSAKPDEAVCSFDFKLNFDTSRLSFKKATLGSKAQGAGKSLSYSKLESNIIRVVVIGFNQKILASAPMGKAEITISKPTVSDPKGSLLAVTTEGGELQVAR
jgi:hypothetical protein